MNDVLTENDQPVLTEDGEPVYTEDYSPPEAIPPYIATAGGNWH